MIIEYFGLPGSGKTYFKLNEINKENKRLLDVNKEYYSFHGKLKRKILSFCKFILPSYKHIYCSLVSSLGADLCKKNKSQINNLTYTISIYKKKSKKYICYADEGILQSLTFLLEEISEDVVLSIIQKNDLTDIKFIYVATEVCQCLANIKKRDRHVCAIDELDSNKLEELLKQKKEIFDYLSVLMRKNGFCVERI